MIQLNYRDSKPIYEQIKDGLKRLVITGAIATDEKLPSVRELASQLAINPNTIAKAFRELEQEGYIYTITGRGSFAADRKDISAGRNDELLKKFDEIVKFSGLKKFLDVPLKNYSSGMKSRLGFSIATIVEPEILILDEVLSVGDAKFRKKSEKKILSMMDKGVTVLFVSHSLEQVKRICTKAMILENGSIRSIGDIDTVSAEYEEMISGD